MNEKITFVFDQDSHIQANTQEGEIVLKEIAFRMIEAGNGESEK